MLYEVHNSGGKPGRSWEGFKSVGVEKNTPEAPEFNGWNSVNRTKMTAILTTAAPEIRRKLNQRPDSER